MTAVGYVLGLTLVWVMLWGTPSAANVLGGLAVGTLLVIVLPGLRAGRRAPVVRPVAVARLAVTVLGGVVASNVLLTREILTRRGRPSTGIITVPLPACSDELVTMITSLLALTPGAMPLEVRDRPRQLVVHVLHLQTPERSRRSVEALVARCIDAFGRELEPAASAEERS